ncbi:Uncharacterised protein [Chlamydia trachomatis]|jgi:hypothetical protein|nr:hypothetical protein DOZ91_08815 [Peribacillus frigoritolerans]CRH75519.1 Uncharacterised protein [Chlamydia trachomatis]
MPIILHYDILIYSLHYFKAFVKNNVVSGQQKILIYIKWQAYVKMKTEFLLSENDGTFDN